MAKGITYKSLTGNHDVTRVIQRAQDVLIEGELLQNGSATATERNAEKGRMFA
ncbi:hypothetical protein H8467_002698 [Salmonella enterica]|nr:hypothetical protein [Salmonella enterica]EGF3848298.1 hypothetical protein [Salmonella enterica]